MARELGTHVPPPTKNPCVFGADEDEEKKKKNEENAKVARAPSTSRTARRTLEEQPPESSRLDSARAPRTAREPRTARDSRTAREPSTTRAPSTARRGDDAPVETARPLTVRQPALAPAVWDSRGTLSTLHWSASRENMRLAELDSVGRVLAPLKLADPRPQPGAYPRHAQACYEPGAGATARHRRRLGEFTREMNYVSRLGISLANQGAGPAFR
ncbi:hypothetical protein M885DRAFT_509514 [Pelagophyceae sp. CCMP2097]|nr:hypothetical protein M885DRAFT_509514 [Pelagophyceae sp. CCMP2097]|mmetsp:Transcript_13517/g.45083  ORF Transcript_13517/g.45083 Transcript_13517/m.45083 type:complete len:215 (-) Transcript_13517:70-714(-)